MARPPQAPGADALAGFLPPGAGGGVGGGALRGVVRVPASKSVAQRVLLAAALARGTTEVDHLPGGRDVRALLGALPAAGVRVERDGAAGVRVHGSGGVLGGTRPVRLEVGESGTAARLVTAALGLRGGTGGGRVAGTGSLAARSSPPLFAALRAAGVGLEEEGVPDGWPVRVTPAAPPRALGLVDPISSQEVSGLLLALAAGSEEHALSVAGPLPSRPYVALTRRVLGLFGARVGGEGSDFNVRGPLTAPAGLLAVEPDASAAAVALAAGALSGGEVRVEGLTAASPQGDVRILEHLGAFGVEAGEEAGALWARGGGPLRGAALDLRDEPDLAPVLAAVAAAAARGGAASRLEGLGTLPGKESSRIQVLAAGLAAVGLAVETGPDWLAVAPGDGPTPGRGRVVALDPHGDHRMAFAFALLSLLQEGVRVRDPGCVAKSWPSFWEDLERAGARRL